jgi:hypothetical protein
VENREIEIKREKLRMKGYKESKKIKRREIKGERVIIV